MTYVLPRVSGPDFSSPGKHEWQDKAACKDEPFETFFSTHPGAVRDAKSFCAVCEVQMDCLIFTIERESKWTTSGVSGNLTAAQRKRLMIMREKDPSLTIEDAYNEIISKKYSRKKPSQELQPL